MSDTLSILVAYQHALVRQGIRAMLERHLFLVAEASDGAEAVDLASQRQFDVALLQDVLPKVNGLDASRQIRSYAPTTGVILLASILGEEIIGDALIHGARGVVFIADRMEDLLVAIRTVTVGGV